jgi:hypothetical protein
MKLYESELTCALYTGGNWMVWTNFGHKFHIQNKKTKKNKHALTCVQKHWIVSYSWKSTFIISAQNALHEIHDTPQHISTWTTTSIQRCLEHLSQFVWIGEERERDVPTLDMEECDLGHVDRDVGVSMRHVGEELNVSCMTNLRLLHKQLLYPCHLQWVQGLADFPACENCSPKC